MRNIRFPCVLFLFLAFLSIDARALCTWQYNSWQGCVSCREWGQAYIKDYNTNNCSPCSGWCRAYLVEGDSEKSVGKVEFVPDASALDRQLNIDASQLQAIAIRNPWAASVLYTLQQHSAVTELRNGTTVLATIPTEEAVVALLAGDASVLQSMQAPAGINARVSHRLERGPGEVARLYLASFTVDSEDRMMFKVYPDVVVEMFEPGAARLPSAKMAGSLIARTWKVAE